MLSRQSTLDELDGMPECIPKTSERARPKLRKIYGMDTPNSNSDSGSSLVSRLPPHPHPPHLTSPQTHHHTA